MRTMLKSKIHRARVTNCNVDYEGSITIDRDLMEAADLLPYEKVDVLDINNGARFNTYVIEGKRGSGEICLNGAAARLVAKGDIVIILSYHLLSEDEAVTTIPRLVYVDSNNRVVEVGGREMLDEGINFVNIEGFQKGAKHAYYYQPDKRNEI